MEIQVCKKCHRIFQQIGSAQLCPSCIKKEEVIFQEVKEFVHNNKGVTITDTVEHFSGIVTEIQIYNWITEERLQYDDSTINILQCNSCGKPIKSGKYCIDCKNDIYKGLTNSFLQDKKPTDKSSHTNDKEKERMRYFGRK